MGIFLKVRGENEKYLKQPSYRLSVQRFLSNVVGYDNPSRVHQIASALLPAKLHLSNGHGDVAWILNATWSMLTLSKFEEEMYLALGVLWILVCMLYDVNSHKIHTI